MLVLSRRTNESIVFPDLNVRVQVVSVKGGTVRLGITAPPEVRVLRAELPDRRAEWAPAAPMQPRPVPAAPALGSVIRRRLQISRLGLAEVQRLLAVGLTADARLLLEKIDEDAALLERRLGEAEGPAGASGRTALLVEDDHRASELLAECLRLAGMEVATADDGEAALDYLRTHDRPDVMLLDMMMPRCDGPTTLRAIRRNPAYAGLKIYGLSGYERDQFDVKCGPEGVNGWFQKPVDPETLVQDLGRELGHARNRLQPATAPSTTHPAQATRASGPRAPRKGPRRHGT